MQTNPHRNRSCLLIGGAAFIGCACILTVAILVIVSVIGLRSGWVPSISGWLDNPSLPGATSADTEPPSLVIENPTTENTFSTLDTGLSISGTASDNQGITKIEWSLQGIFQGVASGLQSWSIQVPLSTGDNRVQVTAFDAAGNSYSDVITITRNNIIVFGNPQIDPAGIQVNQSVDVIIRARVSTNQGLSEGSVRLLQLDGNNNILQQLNIFYDDGDLAHGDDIKGDNVFSTIQNFQVSSPGLVNLRVAASSSSGSGDDYSPVFTLNVFTPLTDQEFNELITTQADAVQVLNDNASSRNLDEALNATTTWLNGLPQVSKALRIENNIEIEYASGISGGIWISEIDSNNQSINKGNLLTTDSFTSSIDEITKNEIPVNTFATGYTAGSTQDIVLDKDVYIYSPFDDIFSAKMRTNLEEVFNKSEIKFNVSSCVNQQCTIDVLKSITNYGVVIFNTHGSGGEHILTGEIATTSNKTSYADLIKQNKIHIWTNITYDKVLWIFNKKADMYSVTSSFISSLSGTFPNSIIHNGSCQSTQTDSLSNAFLGKGAKTYFGYSNNVSTGFDENMSKTLFETLVIDLKTTGESFVAGQADPNNANTIFEMVGSPNMHFNLGLINGDFEYGDLTGWSTDGDGRVISQLGSQTPPQESYMGIISTGLGFTTSKGSISQSFRVNPGETNLSLKWNFLSEEFMEYVGSQYQDTFKILIRDSNGNETTIFEKSIDQFSSEYNLVSVSPEILFDQGDVYMTGWQNFTYDLSAYAGQNITIILLAGDVGDSIFDSAILLDEIYLY